MAKKMKTNQDGGGESSTAAAGELRNNQKGAAKYAHHKGAADYSVKKGSHDHPHGAPKMGYKQSFGAGKANCYAKGAAKVAEIMTFGASKHGYHKGAADSGHGGPDGHTHPTMTTRSIETSGGGSSSSTTTANGNKSAVKGKEKQKVSRETAYNNRSSQYKDMNRDQYNKEIDAYNAKKKKKKINSTSSNSSSNNTSSGNTVRKSETITSKESMAAVKEKGEIANFNRAQKNAYNKEMTNIRAANDSTATANAFLNKRPAHMQDDQKIINAAANRGGKAAFNTRIDSGNFSIKEAAAIYKEGRKISGR